MSRSLPAPVVVSGAHVRWHLTSDRGDPLALHVGEVLGVGAEQVRTGRLCPRCGSSAHGRPWARHPLAAHLSVSLARAGGYVVTAVSLSSPLGVDIEEVDAIARAWPEDRKLDDVVLAPGEEVPQQTRARALTWAAKEATLKRSGAGLHTPMSQVRLTEASGLHELPAPPGLVAVLAGEVPRDSSRES